MESKWGYQLALTASTDLDDIVGYITVELANPKAASDFVDKLLGVIEEARKYIVYYQPDPTEKMIYF